MAYLMLEVLEPGGPGSLDPPHIHRKVMTSLHMLLQSAELPGPIRRELSVGKSGAAAYGVFGAYRLSECESFKCRCSFGKGMACMLLLPNQLYLSYHSTSIFIAERKDYTCKSLKPSGSTQPRYKHPEGSLHVEVET